MKFATAAVIAMTTLNAASAAEIAKPAIVGRTAWKAAAAKPELMKRQPTAAFKGIVVHANDVYFRQREGVTNDDKLRRMQSGHMVYDHKWGDLAYHFFIAKDGWIGEGRSLDYIGDSGTKYDMTGLILVVLEGNFEGGTVNTRAGKEETWPPDTPTDAQKKSLDALVTWLAKTYAVAPSAIKGHKDLAETQCPGKLLYAYLPTLRDTVDAALAAH